MKFSIILYQQLNFFKHMIMHLSLTSVFGSAFVGREAMVYLKGLVFNYNLKQVIKQISTKRKYKYYYRFVRTQVKQFWTIYKSVFYPFINKFYHISFDLSIGSILFQLSSISNKLAYCSKQKVTFQLKNVKTSNRDGEEWDHTMAAHTPSWLNFWYLSACF